MDGKKIKNLLLRYLVATLGLVFVALGVALSLKSDLGTAPISCPPAVLNLRWATVSVGTFTWLMHLVFIAFQVVLLRKNFKWRYLMQIPAAFVFGYMCDFCIWAIQDVQVTSYAMRMVFCVLTVLTTAIGLRIEIIGNAWMLAGDMTIAVLSQVTRSRMSMVKVLFDVVMVVLAVAFAWICFGSPWGNGESVVIREGTLLLALLTGLCMKWTDPLIEKMFAGFTARVSEGAPAPSHE